MFTKLREKAQEAKIKVCSFMATKHGKASVIFGGTMAMMPAVNAAEEITVGNLDFSPIKDAVLSVISMTDIITIIAATIGAGAVFILGWFGVRKIISALKKAIFKGKFGV